MAVWEHCLQNDQLNVNVKSHMWSPVLLIASNVLKLQAIQWK